MYGLRLHFEGEASGAGKEWEAWTRRALEIDRRCGRAWAHLSAMEWYAKKPDRERQLEYALKAASFSPNYAFSHETVANAVVSPGTLSLQLAAALRALNVDPFYLPASGNVALDLIGLGRPEEALLVIDRAMRVEPDAWVGDVRAAALLYLGRLDEARKTLARREPQFLEHPSAPLNQWWGQIRFRLAVAERDAATIEKLERYILPPLLDGTAAPIARGGGMGFVSPALALLGRTDESIRILLRSVEAGILPPYDFLLSEPGFQPLRSDPRFAKVLAASRDGAARIAQDSRRGPRPRRAAEVPRDTAGRTARAAEAARRQIHRGPLTPSRRLPMPCPDPHEARHTAPLGASGNRRSPCSLLGRRLSLVRQDS